MASKDFREIAMEELNRSTPSVVFIRFGFEWEMFEIDNAGNAIPKKGNLKGNAKKSLIKITDPDKQKIFEKLAKALQKYQDFIESLEEENGSDN